MPETMDDLITEFAGRIADRVLLHSDDGGAAYPFAIAGDVALLAHPGMSLLDYFAGKSLIAIAALWKGNIGDFDNEAAERTAKAAYRMADAMLEVRAARTQPRKETTDA